MKNLILIFILLPSISLAELPLVPVSGVKIGTLDSMKVSAEYKQQVTSHLIELNKNGYVMEDVPYANVLIHYQERAKAQLMEYRNNNDPSGTQLRLNIQDIKLAFPYTPINVIKNKKLIGFAPVATYTSKGWTGIKEFFTSDELGVCSLQLKNMKLEHGGLFLNKEAAKYNINNKVATMYAQGSQKSGYLYTLVWGDDTYIYDFECANREYKPKIKEMMLQYAKMIDADLKIS